LFFIEIKDSPYPNFFWQTFLGKKPSDEAIPNTIDDFQGDLELFNDITLENPFFLS